LKFFIRKEKDFIYQKKNVNILNINT